MKKTIFARLRGKLKSKRGFTLIELVCAMLVLTLLGIIISVGVSTAIRVQRESVFISHSDVLTATLNTSLSDVLRYSEVDVEKTALENDGRIYLSNAEYGIDDGYIWVDANGHLGVYMGAEKNKTRYFVSNGTYAGLRIHQGTEATENFTLTYNETTKVFTGSYIVEENTSNEDLLTKKAEFAFKSLVA